MINSSFLGEGVSLSFNIDNRGGVRFSSLEESVKESIFIILSTKIGERVMNYDFGCKIHNLMFKLNTVSTRAMAKIYIEEALNRWEKRIDIKNIEIETVKSNELLIDIEYFIIDENVIDNLVYPFYLLEPK